MTPMRFSLWVGRVAGIDVRAHATFLVVPLIGALAFYPKYGARGAAFGAVLSLAVFGCVLLHELGHALMARRFGIGTRQIVLLPIGGVAELDREPARPSHELAISVAGPLVNLAIAFVLGGVLFAGHASGALSGPISMTFEPGVPALLTLLLFNNLALALFNLLPFFPLDGGRALRALLSLWLDGDRSTRVAAIVGQIGAAALCVAAIVYGQAMLAIVAVFLFFSARGAAVRAAVMPVLERLSAGTACERGSVVLELRTDRDELPTLLMTSGQTVFPVAVGGQLVGVATRKRLVEHLESRHPFSVVGLMDRAWLRVPVTAPVSVVLERLSHGPSAVAGVYDEEDRLVGFVTAEHVFQSVLAVALATDRARASAAARSDVPGTAS